MDRETKPGMNRTGMATSPLQSARAMEVPELSQPSSEGDAQGIAMARVEMAKISEPMGTMPPPASLKEAAVTAGKMLTGKMATVFVDKLGERLAFERSGVRLYDAAISKFDAYGSWEGGPTREALMRIRQDEQRHFQMLAEVIATLGSDPTAVTPSANVHAVASLGIMQVCTDPRATLQQTMEAISIVELADNDCWENLVDLASAMGRDDLAAMFGEAIANEQEHLLNIRKWLAEAISRDAVGELATPFIERSNARIAAQKTRLGEVPIPAAIVAEAGKLTRRKIASAKTSRAPAKKVSKVKAKLSPKKRGLTKKRTR